MRLILVAIGVVGGCNSSTGVGLIQDAPPDGGRVVVVDAGPPPPPPVAGTLSSLSVSPLALSPAFSPDIYDYVVRCAAGTNNLSVTMQTSAGAEASLVSPILSQAAEAQTVPVAIEQDAAIVVNIVSQGGQSSQYWVRCLPPDFPPITLTQHPSTVAPTPGWYLTGNAILTPGTGGFAMVLDSNATPVWYRRVDSGAMNLELISYNVLAFIPTLGTFGSDSTAEYEMDVLDPWQPTYVQAVGTPTDEHELTMMPNGNRLVFSYPLVTGVDLTGLGTLGPNSTVADCEIQELDADDDLIWSWRGLDHIDPVLESTDPNPTQVEGATVIDPIHCNSIEIDPSGDLMVSARDLDAVFLIDTTGTIRWKMGGKSYSKDNAQLLSVEQDPETSFYHQHDARFLADGTVSLFDDHTEQPGHARGVTYALDVAGGTATFVWQAAGVANSTAMGSFRVSADGSRVIDWGASTAPPPSPVFTEVDYNGSPLIDVSFGSGNWAYRTIKVSLDDLDIDVLRATTAHP
jgi:hypothetical protein